MSRYLYYSHPSFFEHEMGASHPERPERLRAIDKALNDRSFSGLQSCTPPVAARDDLETVHESAYVADILDHPPEQGHRYLDPDTAMTAATPEAALRSAGAVIDAVDNVLTGEAARAFCAGRPPGHHAEPDHAMGFCFFSNLAIGALRALRKHGLKRVAMVDFDVHHGNGTQTVAERHEGLYFASSHQSPCYPGTGSAAERGPWDNIVNVELAPGTGSQAFRQGYEDRIFPALRRWKPEFLMISAGFDAHIRDPLAQLCLQDDDFGWVTEELVKIADEYCSGRIVSALEGGYDLEGLAGGVAAHVGALIGADDLD